MSQSNTGSGRLGALNDTFTLGVMGQATVGIKIAGDYSGTISFYGALDGDPIATAVLATPAGGTTAVTSTTSTGVWQANCAGMQNFTVKMTSYASGSAMVTMIAVTSGGGTGGSGGGGGAVTVADGADVAEGSTTDAKQFDANGTVNAHVRATAAVASDTWDSTNHWVKVGVMNSPAVTIAAGSAIIGKVSIDQTTPGTTNGVQVTAALPAGANVIGHVIADTGSTTAVTGNVTVVQATGTSLHAVIDSGSTTAVTGNVTVVQGTGTNLHTVVDAGTAIIGKVGIDQTTPGTTNLVALAANQSVNLAQVAGTNTVTAGVAGSQAVGGSVATNVAIGTNPINNGAQGISSENAAVTTGRMVQLVADLVGKLIVLPYSNPENFVSGAITSAMTGTTSTSCVAAPASGLRNYITQITVSNASTTVPTDIVIQDGSGGTTLYVVPAPAGLGTGTGASGGTFVFPTPLRQPTTATAIFVANVTTGSSTKVSMSGYKGA